MNLKPVKKAYEAVTLFALLNMAVLALLLVYLAASGAINGKKIGLMADVMRGQELIPAPQEKEEPPKPEVEAAAKKSAAPVATSEVDREIMRREADRIKEELRQRLALNNSIMLKATAEREAFEKEREAEEKTRQAREEARQAEGFEKQVAILEAMQPKIAVEHLLGLPDADEAARMLSAMNTRHAKKIVEAAKTDKQRRAMMAIMRRIQDVAPEGTVALNDSSQRGQP